LLRLRDPEAHSGGVYTEVDARLSFDTERALPRRETWYPFTNSGRQRERILISWASTWEGIRAAERLERDGIHCN